MTFEGAPDFADDLPDDFKGLCLLMVSDVGICGSVAEWHIIRKDWSATEVCGKHLDEARWQADYRHRITDACLAPRSGFVAEWNRCVVVPVGHQSRSAMLPPQ